ncbi:hypothetical protein RI129_005409 [Pyrocoelia pectoralis]|uniref:SprT-like domain-containing protein n=1 Tax=Pyrocoelia pectoralis TaxID=417401 RepID=A0AAN7VE51_9COLE
MDSSFLLLSSMSPKINKTAKTIQPKTPRLLALKRNIRRSSNFDNVPHSLQLANSIISVESGTTESISTENSGTNILNATPIIISDSENEKNKVEEKSNNRTEISVKSKFLTISDWIKDVNSKNHFISNNSSGTFNFNDVLNNLPKPNSSIATKSDRLSSSSESEILSDSSNEFHTKLLDELYDGTWRNLKCDILPKSTGKKKTSTKTNRIIRTQNKTPISSCIKTLEDASKDNSDKIVIPLKLRFDSDEDGSDKNSLSKKGSRSCNSGRSCGSNVSDNSRGDKQRVKKTNNALSNKVNNTEEKPKKKTRKCENTLVRTESLVFGKNNILKSIPVPEKSRSNSCQSFLASLSGSVKLSQCDPSARLFRNNFKNYKNELLTRLFKLYNETVFDNKIHDDTPLEWNDKMRGTCRFLLLKARIVLSTKVVDACDRLRDTLIHEMCHAATWIINEVANGHGDYWKAWATKAIKIYPELPPIKRCHDYVINTKYTYQCMDCGYSIGRHSKSLDIERKRCGYCYGKFEVFVNKTNKEGEIKSVPATPKKPPTAFALFVKENYATYKTPRLNHGQVMKLLGQKFTEVKVSL